MSKLTLEWSEYNHDYEKEMQDIRTKGGKEYMCCWPNAGLWNVMSRNGVKPIPDSEVTHTRLTHDENW